MIVATLLRENLAHKGLVVDVAILSDRDAFEELVDFFVRELLAQAREDVAQLADANVACAVLVKHPESADKLLRRARWLESVGPVQDVGECREIDLRGSTRREARHLGLRRVLAQRTQQVAEILTQNRA